MTRRGIDIALLFVLLAIIGLRPIIGEALTSARDPVSAALRDIASPSPARTIAIDIVALAAGAVVIIRSLKRNSPGDRKIGLEWGVLIFAAASAVSCFVAGDKRAAIDASLDWLAALVVAVALVRLLDPGWRSVLALAVLAASGLVNVADCVDTRLTAAQTQKQYLEHQQQIWAQQGIPMDSPQVELFKRRMASNEASGFFSHSNVAGGYLLLGLFISIATATASGTQRPVGLAVGALLAAAFFGGILLTHSTGALAAAVLGMLVVLLRAVFRDAWIKRRKALFIAGWSAVIAGAVVVCGYGLVRGGLPGASLNFRWQYWTASAAMFRDHATTGVGGENFGYHYTAYKPITSSEEVKNPHNFLVQFATEYGVLGLVAALVMLAAGSWFATRPPALLPGDEVRDADWIDAQCLRRLLFAGAGLCVVIFGVRTALLDSQDTAYVYWMTGSGGIVWILGFAATAFALSQSSPAGRAWLCTGCSVGLLVFLVQDTINFALFVPASRMSFLALLAVAVALRQPVDDAGERSSEASLTSAPADRLRSGGVLAVAVAGLGVAIWQIPMVMDAQRWLDAARAMDAIAPGVLPVDQPAHRAYLRATSADRFDPVPPTEDARWLLTAASAVPEHRAAFASAGLDAINTAIARSPQNFLLRERKAQLHMIRGQSFGNSKTPPDTGNGTPSTGAAKEFARAVQAMQEAIARYPEHPRSFVRLADCLIATGDCAGLDAAIVSMQRALDLDAARPKWEQFHRFNPRERNAVQTRIEATKLRREASCSPNP